MLMKKQPKYRQWNETESAILAACHVLHTSNGKTSWVTHEQSLEGVEKLEALKESIKKVLPNIHFRSYKRSNKAGYYHYYETRFYLPI
jgi:hypothetical protein